MESNKRGWGDISGLVLAKKIIDQELNVRQTEQLVKNWKSPDGTSAVSGNVFVDPETRAIEHQLSENIGLVVKVKHWGEKGEVRIEFRSLEQFDSIVKCLNQQPDGL